MKKEPILKAGDSLDFLDGVKLLFNDAPPKDYSKSSIWEDYKVVDIIENHYKVGNCVFYFFFLPIKETDEAILKMELPKEWCVKITEENVDKITALRKSPISGYLNSYITSAPLGELSWGFWKQNSHGVEIPYELFLKHFDSSPCLEGVTCEGSSFVQTKEKIIMKEEAVVYYKLKNEKYFKAAVNLFGNKVASADGIWFDNKGDWKRMAEENDVLDLWFEKCKSPYKKEKVDMGGFELIIRDKKVFYGEEDITWYVKEVRKWADKAVSYSFARDYKTERSFQIDLSSVILQRTGCVNKPSKLSDWLKVYDKIA